MQGDRAITRGLPILVTRRDALGSVFAKKFRDRPALHAHAFDAATLSSGSGAAKGMGRAILSKRANRQMSAPRRRLCARSSKNPYPCRSIPLGPSVATEPEWTCTGCIRKSCNALHYIADIILL